MHALASTGFSVLSIVVGDLWSNKGAHSSHRFLALPHHHFSTSHTNTKCYSYEHHTAKKNCLHWWHHLQAALGRATDEWKAQKCSCIRLPLHFPRKHKPHAMQPASPPQGNRTIMASPPLPWENTTNTLSPEPRRSRTLCDNHTLQTIIPAAVHLKFHRQASTRFHSKTLSGHRVLLGTRWPGHMPMAPRRRP